MTRTGWGAEGGEGGNLGVHRPAETVRVVVPPDAVANDPGVVGIPNIDVEIGRMVSIFGGEWREDREVVGTPMYWVKEEGVVNPVTPDDDCD